MKTTLTAAIMRSCLFGFLFDTVWHQLSWDANGTAANGITLIATFTNNAVLDGNDFELR